MYLACNADAWFHIAGQSAPPHPTPHDANSKPTTSATTSVQNKYRTPAKYAASKYPRERTKKSGRHKHTHPGFLSFYDALLGHPTETSTTYCFQNAYRRQQREQKTKYERDDKRKREKQRVESQWDPISVSLSVAEIPGGYHIGTL